MGHNPARRGFWRAPLLATALTAVLVLAALPARADDPDSDVDSLWNQPEGISVDSGWYFLQAWWDQAVRATQRDPAQRSLAELAQSNSDLLNAYGLLAAAQTDPGPHPVPVVDPLLSSVYGTVTGVKVNAPLGSLFAWLNQAMLTAEGRGSTLDMSESLLRDFGQRQRAADRGLPDRQDLDTIWAANSERQQAMLAKLQTLAAAEGPDATSLTALLTDLDHQRQDLLKHHQSKGKGAGDHGHGNGHQNNKP